MPIYEFHCKKCGRDSEILVRSSNWSGTKCPHCGSATLDKKLSNFAAAGAGNDTSASKTPAAAVVADIATADIEARNFAA
jgi:putative FmdB family regulatory protein